MSIFKEERERRQQAAFERQRKDLQKERDEALDQMEHTFSDGSVVQVRPRDVQNFYVAIDVGLEKRWIMKGNTTRMTTVEELQEAVQSDIQQAETIWDAYADALDELNQPDQTGDSQE